MTLISIGSKGKSWVNAIGPGIPIFIDYYKSDMKILFVPIFGDNTLYAFLTGFLGRFALSHQFHDQKATHGTYYFFSDPCSGGTAHFVIHKESRTNDR